MERWLLKTEEMMRKSLASIVKEAFKVGYYFLTVGYKGLQVVGTKEVTDQMTNPLKLLDCFEPTQAYPTCPREQWILNWPGQV